MDKHIFGCPMQNSKREKELFDMFEYSKTFVSFRINPFYGNRAMQLICPTVCIMPDDFTYQGESAINQWVRHGKLNVAFNTTHM